MLQSYSFIQKHFIRTILISGCLLTAFNTLKGQKLYSISFFNHATTLPPNGFTGPIHPGFDLGISWHTKEKERSISFIHWKVGYYYHRLVHQGIQLYGEYNKQYSIFKVLGLSWSGGLGYLHTIELHEVFKLNSDGTYIQSGKFGKPHAQASLSVGIFCKLAHITPFIQYRVRMVTPFVNSYVPFLPSTSLHIGTYYSLDPKSKLP